MTQQNCEADPNDISPRDQVEHFKMELARLRSENEQLAGEVDYLRQALAAALSKIPQLVPPSADTPDTGESSTPAQQVPQSLPWQQIAAVWPYARYLPVASFMGPPLVLFALLLLTLTCGLVLFVVYLLNFGVA
jgi:hypothetical protein